MSGHAPGELKKSAEIACVRIGQKHTQGVGELFAGPVGKSNLYFICIF